MSSNTDGDEFLTRPSIQLVTVEANVILEPKTSTDSAMTERMPPGLATRQMMTSKWTKRMAGSRMLACYQNVQIALDLGKIP
jgi:hypothetical protein